MKHKMKPLTLLGILFLTSSVVAMAQPLYHPGGSATIGTSGNSRVGIGTAVPKALLNVYGSAYDQGNPSQSVPVTQIKDKTAVDLGLQPNTWFGPSVIANAANIFEVVRLDPIQDPPIGEPYALYVENKLFEVDFSGNVGINTNGATLTDKLTVNGSVKVQNGDLAFDNGGIVFPDGVIRCGQTWCSSGTINRTGNAYINGSGNFKVGDYGYQGTARLEVGASDGGGKWNMALLNGNGSAQLLRMVGGWANGTQPLMQVETAGAGAPLTQTGIVRFVVLSNGNVGIGVANPTNPLEVAGRIRACEVLVENPGWCDYVFEDQYDLRPLAEVEAFIKANKHLPEVPSEADVQENGVKLGEMNAILLKKVEELTLYTIALQKEMAALKASIH